MVHDGLDATAAIRRAIDAASPASAAGGGIVQFEPGTHVLNSGPAPKRLVISASNVVLRGARPGRGGGILA